MIDFDALVLQPCADAFGEPCVFIAVGASPVDIVGTYMEGYAAEVLLDNGETEIATSNPMIGARAAQFARLPEQGDEFRVPRLKQAFKVQNVKPDGVGDLKIELLFAADLP